MSHSNSNYEKTYRTKPSPGFRAAQLRKLRSRSRVEMAQGRSRPLTDAERGLFEPFGSGTQIELDLGGAA